MKIEKNFKTQKIINLYFLKLGVSIVLLIFFNYLILFNIVYEFNVIFNRFFKIQVFVIFKSV